MPIPGVNGSFDATQFQPQQDFSGNHPVGRFPFQISNTTVAETVNKQGGKFVVELTTPAGKIFNNYNLWNNNPKAVEIAQKELSALCYATGIFRLDWNNDGQALRGGRGMVEIGYQKGQEPSAERPQGGYTEVVKVFDSAGNEPGQPNAAPQQQAQPQANAPMQQQPNGGGWAAPSTAPANQPPANAQPAQPGWGNPAQAQPQQAPQQAPQQPGGWAQQPGPSGGGVEAPPWAQPR